MKSVTRFITPRLKLKVNETKSAVARPQERKFLGFSFSTGPEVKRVIAPKALDVAGRRCCNWGCVRGWQATRGQRARPLVPRAVYGPMCRSW